jgi:hypothetical protein
MFVVSNLAAADLGEVDANLGVRDLKDAHTNLNRLVLLSILCFQGELDLVLVFAYFSNNALSVSQVVE